MLLVLLDSALALPLPSIRWSPLLDTSPLAMLSLETLCPCVSSIGLSLGYSLTCDRSYRSRINYWKSGYCDFGDLFGPFTGPSMPRFS